MFGLLQDLHSVHQLIDQTGSSCHMVFGAATVTTSMTALCFQVAYAKLGRRIEKPSPNWAWLFNSTPLHLGYTLLACFAFGFVHFIGLGVAVSIAAAKCMVTDTFDYEVAAKPTKESRLED